MHKKSESNGKKYSKQLHSVKEKNDKFDAL